MLGCVRCLKCQRVGAPGVLALLVGKSPRSRASGRPPESRSDEPDKRRRRESHEGRLVHRSARARRWKALALTELSFQASHQAIELRYHRPNRVGLREVDAGALEQRHWMV